MKLKLSLMAGLVCLMGALDVSAVTLIEQRDGDSTTIMYVDGVQMRTEFAGKTAYVLINMGKRQFFNVDPKRKTAVDMSSMMWTAVDSEDSNSEIKVAPSLDKMGDGPMIAGYSTVHYALKANGKTCQEWYASKDAFKDSGLSKMWEEYGEVWKEMGAETDNACDIAEREMHDPWKTGWTLKTVNREREHVGQFTEVLRIEKDVAVPPGGFDVPSDYKIVNYQAYQQMMSGMNSGSFDMGNEDENSYSDEEDYDDENYDEEEIDEEDAEGQAFEEELEEDAEKEAGDVVKDKLKGFMNKFKKKKD